MRTLPRCPRCDTPWHETVHYKRLRVAALLVAVPLAGILGLLVGWHLGAAR